MKPRDKGRLRTRFQRIKERCEKKENKDFPIYGGRGITCDFKNPSDFIDWFLGELKKMGFDDKNPLDVEFVLDNFQVDRIDGKKGYSRDNCQLLEKDLNELLQSHSVSSICIQEGVFAPLWVFDKFEGLSRKSTKKRIKKLEFSSEFSYKKEKRFLNAVWYDFSRPPLRVNGQNVECPECGKSLRIQRVLKCECGFCSNEPKVIKMPHNRETIRLAIKEVCNLYEVSL